MAIERGQARAYEDKRQLIRAGIGAAAPRCTSRCDKTSLSATRNGLSGDGNLP